jgi:hypothetical protein
MFEKWCTFALFLHSDLNTELSSHSTHEEQISAKYPQSCSFANMMQITFETCS